MLSKIGEKYSYFSTEPELVYLLKSVNVTYSTYSRINWITCYANAIININKGTRRHNLGDLQILGSTRTIFV